MQPYILKPFLFFLSICLIILYANCQLTSIKKESYVNEVIDAFYAIDETGEVIEYTNAKEVNHQGGHLQGIQSAKYEDKEYFILTGSSSTYAYYAIIRNDDKNEVISVNKILNKPYKHAGGFQIHEHYMAIGIEDNEARDKSKIYIYSLENPENPPQIPVAVIDREGDYERATAGSVGITSFDNKVLLVVGDWSSRNLDFYLSPKPVDHTDSLNFEKVYSINAREIDKQEWVNKKWLSYQNINIIQDNNHHLYLIGLTRNKDDQDVADLFRLYSQDLRSFEIRKVATRNFQTQKGTSFKWAGAKYNQYDNSLLIFTSTDQLDERSYLNIFR